MFFETPTAGPDVWACARGLLTGQQAKVWANDFMAVHLSEMPYGGVYAKVSAAALASPKNTQLATVRQTVFMGTTLRGLLLEAYAFSVIGTIMLWGAIASFIAAAILAVLVVFGFAHALRTSEETELIKPKVVPTPATA